MAFYNAFDQCQSDTSALTVTLGTKLEEHSKNVLLRPGWNSRTVIGDAEFVNTWQIAHCYLDFPVLPVVMLEGVAHEVSEHLFERCFRGLEHRHARVPTELELFREGKQRSQFFEQLG